MRISQSPVTVKKAKVDTTRKWRRDDDRLIIEVMREARDGPPPWYTADVRVVVCKPPYPFVYMQGFPQSRAERD